MSRLRHYRDILASVPLSPGDAADYVKMHLHRKQRAMLAKLRSGTLRIAIETGRYRQIPADERICKQCNTDTVEHAEDFLFYCPNYNIVRQIIIPEQRRVTDLFATGQSMQNVAKYIIDCLNSFHNLQYIFSHGQ